MENNTSQEIALKLDSMPGADKITQFENPDYHAEQILKMKLMKMINPIMVRILGLLTLILIPGCKSAVNNANPVEGKEISDSSTRNEIKQNVSADTTKSDNTSYKVTFIELGSVRCIPCQHMQIVMKSIREKYGKEVNVVFYDAWTPEGRPYGEKYGINAIPTQVFLDKDGEEYFRHEGFFPEEELLKVLKTKGVK